ncbi:MAG: hypothetical protein JW788_01310 [Candidatus Omnitrophica bacterium]|nr:hypothetical protein [Candidatus Omnitrophota bacterium]
MKSLEPAFISWCSFSNYTVKIISNSARLNYYVSRCSTSFIRIVPSPKGKHADLEVYLNTLSTLPEAPKNYKKITEADSQVGVFECYSDSRGGICLRNKSIYVIGNTHKGRCHLFFKELRFSRSVLINTLLLFLKHRGLFALHSALVKRRNIGIMLPGESGVGKTTLAHNLRRRDFEYLCDDLCLLTRSNEKKVGVFPLDKDLSRNFFWYRKKGVHGKRAVKRFSGKRKTRKNKMVIPKVIIFPCISGGSKSTLSLLPFPQIFMRLIGSSLMMCFENKRMINKHTQLLRDLASQCACFELRAGTNKKETSKMLAKAISRLIK